MSTVTNGLAKMKYNTEYYGITPPQYSVFLLIAVPATTIEGVN